ncbi:MAG: hypothetical protein RR676_11135 [Acinetobacter sp.]
MDKLKLAHSYMVEYVKKNGLDVSYSDVSAAFDIAEAMLAEQEKRADKTRPAVLDDFQVDWNFAPDWGNWWAVDLGGCAFWYESKPFISEAFDDEWVCRSYSRSINASPFNYQGDWKSSLQERK